MMAVRSGKIPTTSVRRRISRSRRWLGLLEPDLAPDRRRERGEGQDLLRCGVEVDVDLGQLCEVVRQLVELGVDGVGVDRSKIECSIALTPPQACLGHTLIKVGGCATNG
jgi:hypothetical protein